MVSKKGRLKTYFALIFALLGVIFNAKSQHPSIGGVYNTYAKAIEIPTNCKIIVDTPSSFQSGDKILIIQMKGAVINRGDSAAYGDIISYGEAGNYEVAKVNSINSDTLLLEYQLLRNYEVNDLVQVISAKQFSSVQVDTELKAKPWDGNTGGVVFIDVNDSVVLNNKINVKGMGYKGGQRSEASVNCNFPDYFTSNVHDAAQKGESFVFHTNKGYGRGALAAGGGGGNNHNAGGGGGANFGKGGIGGKEYDHGTGACNPTFNNGGIGGKQVIYSSAQNRVFMGSGGGGGHQNDWLADPRGGIHGADGGGLVIIRCQTLITNGQTIDADGMSKDSLSGRDGAGGGGAGGSILIQTQKIIGTINAKLSGGHGGSIDNANFNSICHGPGGGGGGGLLWINSSALLSNFNITATGGIPGKNVNANSFCFNSNYGAKKGAAGGSLTDLSIPEGNVSCPWSNLFIEANNDTITVTCGQNVNIDVQNNDQGGSLFSTSILTPPTQGTALLLNGDSIQYSCNGASGLDSIIYVICLNAFPNVCDTAVVYINITKPIANDDSKLTPKNTKAIIPVTKNDSTGSNYGIKIHVQPQFGSVNIINKDSIEYTPNNGFVGDDSLQYCLCFKPNDTPCDTAVVRIKVFDIIANDDSASTSQGTPVKINVLNNDIHTFSVFVVIICFPENGSVLANQDQTVTYTPNPGFIGLDSFCYVICSLGVCDTAYVKVDVKEIIIPDIIVPNGFSPNGDGQNDFFVIEDILYSNDNELRIFNRWGQEIYSTANYKNTWNGKNNSGGDLPDGTYFYVLNVKDLGKNYSGYVVIQR